MYICGMHSLVVPLHNHFMHYMYSISKPGLTPISSQDKVDVGAEAYVEATVAHEVDQLNLLYHANLSFLLWRAGKDKIKLQVNSWNFE